MFEAVQGIAIINNNNDRSGKPSPVDAVDLRHRISPPLSDNDISSSTLPLLRSPADVHVFYDRITPIIGRREFSRITSEIRAAVLEHRIAESTSFCFHCAHATLRQVHSSVADVLQHANMRHLRDGVTAVWRMPVVYQHPFVINEQTGWKESGGRGCTCCGCGESNPIVFPPPGLLGS